MNKPQTAALILFVVCGFILWFDLVCDWLHIDFLGYWFSKLQLYSIHVGFQRQSCQDPKCVCVCKVFEDPGEILCRISARGVT